MTDPDADLGSGGEDGRREAGAETDRSAGDAADGGPSSADESTPDRPEDVPVFDDEYLDAVALRLMHHYDIERDFAVGGHRFPLYAEMEVLHERHAIHPALTFAHHEAREHVFAERIDRPTVEDLESIESFGERLADEWIDADETHYSTDFSVAVVARELPDDVREFVSGYENRTLLKYGYFGHYELNLVVVVPEREESVGSANADVEQAFRVWEPIVPERRSRLDRFLDWLSR